MGYCSKQYKQQELKQKVARRAIDFIESGMFLGIGSGTTVHFFIEELGRLVNKGLAIRAIPTSRETQLRAERVGIPLGDFSSTTKLDITIDGADEVDEGFNLIKGGGGALLREKLVAKASEKFIVIIDESKLVSMLGSFPLPVEIVPFAWQTTLDRLKIVCPDSRVRAGRDGNFFVTDNHNYIVDCHWGSIPNPVILERELKTITGVVEVGLFTRMTHCVLVAHNDGTVSTLHE